MPHLRLEKLGFTRQGRVILRDLSLSFAPGQLVCLMGANGAGKTTLLRLILGLLRASDGEIMLDGRAVHDFGRRDLARILAYVPQNRETPPPYSVDQIVAMGRLPYKGLMRESRPEDQGIVTRILTRLGLNALRDRPCTSLSGGEYQRVLLARALVQETPVLVLDEPLSGLDFGHQIRLMALLGALGKAGRLVLMTAHQPDLVYRYATHVVLLEHGRVLAQGTPDVILDAGRLSAFYETPLTHHDIADDRFFAGET
ncbi:ABC transporter ATP-binding protein [Asaia krungthepensis]|uniref:Ferrichrome ABC transporter ATP-binding protein n=1 Tax=Asaia krungthepensis NRIC 0535 TaxID=1307925 RepID=A0ABQ0Q0E8_9PROT|nr:ABC transporter ATP-binding protein [Asaia krungthepensis]GBQ86088.1 ferrichrome ABC transporter ATP-binding protein [Asaia krungthepensis NRIC 0535]